MSAPNALMDRCVFHLSLPTRDLAATRHFYRDVLGAAIGRESLQWIDVWLFGHQLTFHTCAEAPSPGDAMHFGVVLDWARWTALGERVAAAGCEFVFPPTVFDADTPGASAKWLLRDPAGYLLEFKAYRAPHAVRTARDPGEPDGDTA